jgi:FlgO protein
MSVRPLRCLHLMIFLVLGLELNGQELGFDQGVAALAEQLSAQVAKAGVKRIAVSDFTDLQSVPTELGRIIAEQISIGLISTRDGFGVMDRANLNRILAEHRLTAAGLVDPDNAKKLGQFAGVDAIVVGNAIPFTDDVLITAKIVATETAEIVGALQRRVPLSADIKDLAGRTVVPGGDTARAATGGQPHFERHGVRVDIDSIRSTNAGLAVVARIRNGGRRAIALLVNGNESQVTCDRGFTHFFESAAGIGQYQRSGATPVRLASGSEETATLRFHPMNRSDLEPQDRGHSTFDLQFELVSLIVYESGEASELQEVDRKISISVPGLTLHRNRR